MPDRRAGFTLIELMVVIILVGLVFTYGMVKVDHLVPKARLDKAARDIGSMMTRLRQNAVFSGSSYYLEYDLDGQQYRMARPTTDAEQDEGAEEFLISEWFGLPRNVRIVNLLYSDRDTVTRGMSRVEFTSNGEVVGHLVHVLSDEILQESRNRFTVELNPITGLVSYTQGIHKEYDQVRNEFEFR